MSTPRVGKPSSVRCRQVLSARVRELGVATDMPCSAYSVSGVLYVFSDRSFKCVECIRRGVRCDGNFSAVDFDRLGREKVKLKQACQDALDRAARSAANVARETVEAARGAAEAASLNRRITALDKARGVMIERESVLLAELD
jgi:hypothetical protein